MGVFDGRGTFKRRRAKNFIGDKAQKRLDELVPQIQTQVLNAQHVDAHEVWYFSRFEGADVCTCRETQLLEQDRGLAPNIAPASSIAQIEGVELDYRRPLFGEHGGHADYSDIVDDDEFELDEGPVIQTHSALIDSGADCGICYKNGSVPAFTVFGHDRQLCTTFNVSDIDGYFIDRATQPHVFNRQRDDGYVEFLIDIPLYFEAAFVSVRQNLDVLEDEIYFEDAPLTVRALREHAGGQIAIQVRTYQFTHVTIHFDLGTKVRVSIAQISKTTDWTLFDTIGNMNVSLPVLIPEVRTGDVLYIPRRKLALKVTDVPFMRTANGQALDWQATVRVLQPQEALRWIAKCVELL